MSQHAEGVGTVTPERSIFLMTDSVASVVCIHYSEVGIGEEIAPSINLPVLNLGLFQPVISGSISASFHMFFSVRG